MRSVADGAGGRDRGGTGQAGRPRQGNRAIILGNRCERRGATVGEGLQGTKHAGGIALARAAAEGCDAFGLGPAVVGLGAGKLLLVIQDGVADPTAGLARGFTLLGGHTHLRPPGGVVDGALVALQAQEWIDIADRAAQARAAFGSHLQAGGPLDGRRIRCVARAGRGDDRSPRQAEGGRGGDAGDGDSSLH